MTHITPPEPDITLYETGFDPAIDLLGRAETGKSLSDLVMRIDDPLVIALDGGWGSGKSFFLKCWVGGHLKDHGETSQTVYFDAFEHDFIDAPLASLMGVLAERLEPPKEDEAKTGKAVAKATLKVLRKVALPLTRLGLAAATYGATEAAGAIGDALINQASTEFDKAAEDFWSRESGQRAAMVEFKDVLAELTGGEDAPQKLIIVIDELDRCRPDYALSLLEIIKHFFAVPNVHFVLGVNMTQLENSVHARYGAGIDAGLYLQKFVGLTMRLPETTDGHRPIRHSLRYFGKIARLAGMDSGRIDLSSRTLAALRDQNIITLRGTQRLIALLQLTSYPWGDFEDEEREKAVATSLTVLRIWYPDCYAKARNGTIDLSDLEEVLTRVSDGTSQEDRFSSRLFDSWLYYLDPGQFVAIHPNQQGRVTASRAERMRELQTLIRKHLETFSLPDATP